MKKAPPIVLVHDWFNTKIGGAERVAIELSQLFPKAPIYTLIYNQTKFAKFLPSNRVHTSFLQKMPGWIKNRPRYLLPLIPAAIKGLSLPTGSLIISSSSAFAKNVKRPAGSFHICYCHTPMRFAYDYKHQYLQEQAVSKLQQFVAHRLRNMVGRWDQRHIGNVDLWLANSHTVAKRLAKYYGQTARVIYPPVDTGNFNRYAKTAKQDFYITISALTPYKKIDLVIAAAAQAGFKLKIIGEGPEMSRLKTMAPANVTFLGYVDEHIKGQLLAQAKGLIFPNEEDFGIAMVEALAAGTPVIAYNRGGATEIVKTPSTGVLFSRQTPEAIIRALDQAGTTKFKTNNLLKQARQFDSQIFRQQIRAIINEAKLPTDVHPN